MADISVPSRGEAGGRAPTGRAVEAPSWAAQAVVLVVDDVAENRDLLIRRLKRLGIGTVEEAVNGREALEAIERRNFDLVLLDIMMPEVNGFEVLEALKRDGRTNDLPVVVISALNEIDPIVRCVELGAEDFIFKPFNPTLLRARVMATLEKKILRDQTRAELQRKQAELSAARTLQLALVPKSRRHAADGRSIAVDAVLEPAKEVGGDLVDHFMVGNGLLVLVLGDVSDKGAGAALMMARTHALFRGLAGRPDASELLRAPQQAVALVNAALAEGNATCMFVTLFFGVLDVNSGGLTYVLAGHIPPFLRRADGAVERLGDAGGLPLGIVEDAVYASATAELRRGDRLLVLTDGVTEAADPRGDMFGEARVAEFFAGPAALDGATLAQLVAQVREFEAGLPAADDVAALLLATD